MSTSLDLVCRTALEDYDERVVLQVAKNVNECALFVLEYTRIGNIRLRATKGNEISRFKNNFNAPWRNMDIDTGLSLVEHISGGNEDLYMSSKGAKDEATVFHSSFGDAPYIV
ncbi:hypothetical protein BOTBODRAFT_36672 [Botryobasidium botryosum FD-172 SS1]|uniref:Uncharacterized protein n=1 Tax=Botryobasidium botryosum (strain FD-172 SS1) TaxID=930990 RepID=A0A067M2U4_BOTB1|nr:hypothetical protein BOTBODRAFT_36672 [Botryobasidium botryosum FD-172 SS1]